MSKIISYKIAEVTNAIMLALLEQHKDTRHDAVDKILEIRERWGKTHNFSVADSMFNEITGAIMNLKQSNKKYNLTDSLYNKIECEINEQLKNSTFLEDKKSI
jgi:hypothetical protein